MFAFDPEEEPVGGDEAMGADDDLPTDGSPDVADDDPAVTTQGAPGWSPDGGAEPRSEAQRRASRDNGRKSCGPATPEGKAKVSGNATTHGGYSDRPVIRTGVFREDPEEYERNLSAFLAAVKPVNALAAQQALRVFRAYRKSDRVDRFEVEALEHAGRMPEVDPNLDAKAHLAMSRLDSAEADVEWFEGLLERHDTDPDSLDLIDWQHLWGVANDPALYHLFEQTAQAEESPAAQAAMIRTARSAIERSLTAQHGSVGQAIEEKIKACEWAARRHMAELEALQPPPTEEEYGSKVAYDLISGGFFDRLSRPRATSYRAIRQAWQQFTACQELGPDAPDEPERTSPA